MSRARPGKTLLEAVVIITLLSIVVGLSTTALATLFRLRGQFSRDAELAATLSRLSLRLRADAHESLSATVQEGCTFELADGRTIEYTYDTPRIVRLVRQAGNIVHRDSFRLPKNAVVAFEREAVGDHALIRLTVGPPDAKTFTRDLPRGAKIEVATGIARHLEQIARRP
jgi:hypothetical protein